MPDKDTTNEQQRICDLCLGKSHQRSKKLEQFLGLAPASGHSILTCNSCGLAFIHPRPSQETLNAFYDQYGSLKNRSYVENFREEKIYPQKLRTLAGLTQGKRLLDIGSGMGTFAHLAKEAGYDVTGIELSDEQCQKAKELYNIELINDNIYEVSDKLGPFDIIHLHHVLEHLTSPAHMLTLIHKLLKPDGILLLEVPYQRPRVKDLLKIGSPPQSAMKFNFDHLYFFTPRILNKYVNKHGFKAIRFSQFPPMSNELLEGNCLHRTIRGAYRYITTKLWLPSGRIIELYCQKK